MDESFVKYLHGCGVAGEAMGRSPTLCGFSNLFLPLHPSLVEMVRGQDGRCRLLCVLGMYVQKCVCHTG
jgi:hypothetical protein